MKQAQHITLKKLVVATLMATMVIAMLLALSPAPKPQIFGNISGQDATEVTRIVRVAMKEPILPDLSWESIRSLPVGIRQRWSERIISIHWRSNETVKVTTGVEQGLMSMSQYNLKKTAKGWEIADIVSSGGLVAAPSN